jgi:CTP:molybdopterin cytidylyltransferase MocA
LNPSLLASAPHALILAAGEGTRFGGPKLLALLRGKPLAQYVIDAVALARSSGVLAGAVAVVARDDAPLRDLFQCHGIEVVESDHPARGLAHSLRLGLETLASAGQRPWVEAAMVLLADQPMVRVTTIAALVTTWRQGFSTIIRPRYALHPEEPGHPVLLGRPAWPLANEAQGDRGIGIILGKRPTLVTLVDVPGANPDIDTPADLAALERTL